jgi:hypothetical protein
MAGLWLLAAPVSAQEELSVEERLIGVWRMDPRTLEAPGAKFYQEDGTVSILERLPDGRFRVIARITTRAVSETDMTFNEPGCVNTKECTYDSATEGIGAVFRNTMYIDWVSEGWIDDVFTIKGNVMTGDDGNGPIRLVKEKLSSEQGINK